MSSRPRRRASVIEYAYAVALGAAAVIGALAPEPPPPATPVWSGPFPTVRLGERPASSGPLATTRVNEPVDLEALAPPPRGDPYDAVAVATFENVATGDVYRVQAFYDGGRDGLAAFRFRFAPPGPGEWRFETASEVQGLGGHAGVVVAEPGELLGPLTGANGRFVLARADGTTTPTTYNVLSPLSGPLDDLGALPRDESALVAALEPVVASAAGLGFDALHVAVNHAWFSLGVKRSDQHASVQPDPRTFRVLETLAALAHRSGVFLHLWQWGDESRRFSPIGLNADPGVAGDAGGAGGAAFDRLQRYLAARLGPLPNWTMSYGFDLDEWATVAEARAWADRLEELLPVPHLLAATEEGSGSRAFDLGADKLSLASRDAELEEGGPLDFVVEELRRAGGRPLLLESDIRHLEDGGWSVDAVRRTLWRLALAGGVGAIWELDPERYAEPEQLRTFGRFWDGRVPADGSASRLPGGELVLVSSDGSRGVVYAEDATTLALPVAPVGARVVAVDAAAPYEELAVAPGATGVWAAPYRSDWAVAFASP